MIHFLTSFPYLTEKPFSRSRPPHEKLRHFGIFSLPPEQSEGVKEDMTAPLKKRQFKTKLCGSLSLTVVRLFTWNKMVEVSFHFIGAKFFSCKDRE